MQRIQAVGLTWHHADRFDETDLIAFEERFKFHPLDLEDVRGEVPLSKLDAYPRYLFAVFLIPTLDEKAGRVRAAPLFVFLGKDFLVTLAKEHIPAITLIQERLTHSAKTRTSQMGKGSAFFLYRLLHDAFRGSMSIVSHLAAQVAHLEAELETSHSERTTAVMARTRRDILYLRHLVDPQRHILTSLASMKRPFLPEGVLVYFDDLRDSLDGMWMTSDNLKNLLEGLFDVNEVLLSHRTNRIVTVLTMISAALMAPTLVAGFYGMNVHWLPGIDRPVFVGVLYLVSMVVVIATVMLIIRRDRS